MAELFGFKFDVTSPINFKFLACFIAAIYLSFMPSNFKI
ncbi:hypothetical protein CAMRE0001_0948 [Campylobacter rectus RM3267]|uniref:Uncharacterized protein n=1 Tax=Campylobacter rectus RM3267 TaxID=553218 RepID=B9D2L3_CAMRE|nr:hypothetical protein CAMRE0001_0948 [Campylobacter rectus RM3267]